MRQIVKKVLFVLFLCPMIIFGQELSATVILNIEQLSTEQKDKVRNLKQDLENYLNNTQFTENAWEWDKISCTFNIFFISGAGTSYSAQVVVTSQRPVDQSNRKSLILNIMDQQWKFNYEEGQSMYFKEVDFDPFISFLDFYAYLIIGFDSDTYDIAGGSEWFNKALEVVVKGAGSNNKLGWEYQSASYNRRALLDDLQSANYQQFREDYYDYHFNGLDIFTRDKKKAQANIVKLINHLKDKIDQLDPRSVLLRVFFNAKAGEIADYLSDYPDKTIFNTLIKIDNSNMSKYEKALE